MSIEPTNAFTVCIPAVLPPKSDPKPLAPRFTPEEDAARIRARYRRTWGADSASEANERARLEAKAKRSAQIEQIAALMARHGEMTVSDVQGHMALSREQTRVVLRLMRIDGRAEFFKRGGNGFWRLTA